MLQNTAIILKSGPNSFAIPTPRSFVNVEIDIESDSHIRIAIDLLCIEFYFGEHREDGSVLNHAKRVTNLALITCEGNNANRKFYSSLNVYALAMFHDVYERYVFTDLALQQFESAMTFFISTTFIQDSLLLQRSETQSRAEYIDDFLQHGTADVLLVKMADLLDRINSSKNDYKVQRAILEYSKICKVYNLTKGVV